MRKSVRSECRVQNFELSGGNRGCMYVVQVRVNLVYPDPLYIITRDAQIEVTSRPKKSSMYLYSVVFPCICSISYDEILIDSQAVLHPHHYAYKGDKGNFHKSSSFSFEIPLL